MLLIEGDGQPVCVDFRMGVGLQGCLLGGPFSVFKLGQEGTQISGKVAEGAPQKPNQPDSPRHKHEILIAGPSRQANVSQNGNYVLTDSGGRGIHPWSVPNL